MKHFILVLASLMLLAPVSLLAGKDDVEKKEKSKEEKVQVVVTEIPDTTGQDAKEQVKEETNEANKEDMIVRETNHN